MVKFVLQFYISVQEYVCVLQNMNNEFYLGHKHRESTTNVLIISYMIFLSFHLPLLYVRLKKIWENELWGTCILRECLVIKIRCGYLNFILTLVISHYFNFIKSHLAKRSNRFFFERVEILENSIIKIKHSMKYTYMLCKWKLVYNTYHEIASLGTLNSLTFCNFHALMHPNVVSIYV